MTLVFYKTAGGAEPVKDYILGLSDPEIGRLLAMFRMLNDHGLDAPVDLKHVDGKLWEIRDTDHRIFYVMVDGPTMVLLHAYKKEGRKAPLNDLKTARSRMAETLIDFTSEKGTP